MSYICDNLAIEFNSFLIKTIFRFLVYIIFNNYKSNFARIFE